jgi:hypothetical protein
VTPLLVGDAQVDTGLLPFGAVWRNPPSSGAKLGKDMRQFMSQSAINFTGMLD